MLTQRDTKVLRNLALGHDNASIAAALHVTARTIADHVAKVMRKIQAHSPLPQ